MSAPKQNEQFESQYPLSAENQKEAGIIWSKFLEIIKSNVSELKFNTWFKPITPKSFQNNSLLISVPSQDFYDMVISRFGDKILAASKTILGKDGKLLYEITSGAESKEKYSNTPKDTEVSEPGTVDLPDTAQSHAQASRTSLPSKAVYNLDPNYTFENFVKGKNNEFATAAALSISNSPAAQYNPLLIYGGVGLGKTHLMQAIGNYLLSTHRAVNIMYISGPEFTTSFIQSIRSNTVHEFERFYKSLDI
jgi:chromosomal replication initiator protein